MNNAKSWLYTKLSIFSVMPPFLCTSAIPMFMRWLCPCAQQPRDAIEAAVKATMTAQFDKEMAVAVEAENKRTELVKDELLAMQRTAENLKRDGELAVMRAKDALRGSHLYSFL